MWIWVLYKFGRTNLTEEEVNEFLAYRKRKKSLRGGFL